MRDLGGSVSEQNGQQGLASEPAAEAALNTNALLENLTSKSSFP